MVIYIYFISLQENKERKLLIAMLTSWLTMSSGMLCTIATLAVIDVFLSPGRPKFLHIRKKKSNPTLPSSLISRTSRSYEHFAILITFNTDKFPTEKKKRKRVLPVNKASVQNEMPWSMYDLH